MALFCVAHTLLSLILVVAHTLSVIVWRRIWFCTDDRRPDLLLTHDPDSWVLRG